MQGLEGHCEYCHKDGAVNASVSNKLAEVTEKAIQSMQKKIDELAQKLNEYTPQPTLQPLSPPQARVYNAMQPPTLFHSVPQASLHQVNESPMGQSASYCSIKHEVQQNVSHGDSQRETQTIAETLQKFSSLHTESKIGVLAVKLAREAIFRDDICFDVGWTLLMCSFNSCHRFSIELRSGDSGGVGHQLMPCSA